MLSANAVPLDPAVQALVIGRRCSFHAAVVVQACRPGGGYSYPKSIREVIYQCARWKLTEEEARAGIAEAFLADLIYTDSDTDFRPGDAAFVWARVDSKG